MNTTATLERPGTTTTAATAAAAAAFDLASAHTAVSNLPEHGGAGEAAARPMSTAPEEGKDSAHPKAQADGSEVVAGYKPRAESRAVMPAFDVPDLRHLRDIGEASFGTPPAAGPGQSGKEETVHGPDDRVRITNTGDYPWRVHASLLITAADNSQWIGTGWFIGPHTLMTAGHVVFIKNSGVAGRDGWVKRIQVMAGRNGSTLPFGSVTSSNFRSVLGWTNGGNENFDYGAIVLPTDLGSTTGWLGFGVYNDADLTGTVGNLAGYPGDKPSGTLWYASNRIASVNATKVYYDIDSYGGQSGSAVYRIVANQRFAFAVHAYGGAVTNSGTRITQPVYANMVAWRA